jgi:HK97 family phage prohead protease
MTVMYDEAMARLDEILEGTGLSATGATAPEPKVKEMLVTEAKVATTTERGEFSAVVSSVRPDREGDIVHPSAMVDALAAWAELGKAVPLAWEHRTDPDEIVGHVDAASARETNGEVVVDGWVDRSIPRGRQAWRLVKSGVIGLSFGYLVTGSVKRDDGTRELTGIDVFEITLTVAPMNGDTRITGWKSTEQPEPEVPEPETPTPEELRARSDALERELGLEPPEITEAHTQMRDEVLRHLRGSNDDATDEKTTAAELKAKCAQLEREHAPVVVASFDC